MMTTGVDRYVILGVWGLETKYGTYVGDTYVIRSLATLASAGYRGAAGIEYIADPSFTSGELADCVRGAQRTLRAALDADLGTS